MYQLSIDPFDFKFQILKTSTLYFHLTNSLVRAFLRLNAFIKTLFCLKICSIPTQSYSTFHSLLLHILDSDRARLFMVGNKQAFPHVSLPEFGLHFLLYLDVSVSLDGLYELRFELFLWVHILTISVFMIWLLVTGLYILQQPPLFLFLAIYLSSQFPHGAYSQFGKFLPFFLVLRCCS